MQRLHDLPAVALAQGIRDGRFSSVAAVEACLARIAEIDGRIQAWVSVDRSGALLAAQALDAESRAGRFRGPLHGVPVGVKDIFDVAGMVTTSGAAAFAHRRPHRDAAAVAALRAAGAVILGKTTTTAFAFADPTGTRNPWHLEHTPGGSSSGSAAAVAAGMVPLALGTQTIGSVLRPAAYCGIVGLKGTYGTISVEGVTPLAWSLDHVGVFGRRVDDVAVAFDVLAAPQRRVQGPAGGLDAAEAADAVRPAGRPIRLGLPRSLYDALASDEVRAHLEETAAGFTRAGAAVMTVDTPPEAADLFEAGRRVLRVEAAAYHEERFGRHGDEYPPKIRELVQAGLAERGVDYVRAQQVRAQVRRAMAPVFARVDALLMPVAPGPAPRGLDSTGDPVLCAPWSFIGTPAIALPSGLSAAGVPLAVQLAAGPGAEARLLDVARWCEAQLAFDLQPPG